MLSLSTHSYLTADLSPSSYKIKVNKCSWAEKKRKKRREDDMGKGRWFIMGQSGDKTRSDCGRGSRTAPRTVTSLKIFCWENCGAVMIPGNRIIWEGIQGALPDKMEFLSVRSALSGSAARFEGKQFPCTPETQRSLPWKTPAMRCSNYLFFFFFWQGIKKKVWTVVLRYRKYESLNNAGIVATFKQ